MDGSDYYFVFSIFIKDHLSTNDFVIIESFAGLLCINITLFKYNSSLSIVLVLLILYFVLDFIFCNNN